jgi:putative SOS response-associated peptidase YedK
MCGRFTLATEPKAIAALFQMPGEPELPLRYNVAPTQTVPAARRDPQTGRQELSAFRWGLIPHWAKDTKAAAGMINARSETVAEKLAFRSAFRQLRYLIPASGFYEWAKPGPEPKAKKQPWYFRLASGQPFAFAGLWELWHSPDGEEVQSCALLTTEANETVRPVRDRMPVILPPADFARWLDPALQDPVASMPLLQPYPAREMVAYPVGLVVNSPKNNGPDCISPLA